LSGFIHNHRKSFAKFPAFGPASARNFFMKHSASAKTFTKTRQAVSYIYRQTAILSFFKDSDRLY
jgi:hypothetical protein